MSDNTDQLIRNSLWNSVFTIYTQLVQTIKTLPYDQTNPSLHKSLSYIDDGILWSKETIMGAPLILATPVAVDEPTPTSGAEPTEDQIDSK